MATQAKLARKADVLRPRKRSLRRVPVRKERASSKTTHPSAPEPSVFFVVPAPSIDASQAVNVEERDTAYTVVLGLSGIDPRTVSVLARPHSLLVEVSVDEVLRHTLVHEQAVEVAHQSISREFRFPTSIERGCTVIQIRGAFLEIVAQKARGEKEEYWSDLIRFDSRSSRGCA